MPLTPPHIPAAERGDAARNRAALLDAARRLIAESGADALTMDDLARAAGVGKGTVFRRFGSRAGLMAALLDEDERANQQAFLFGPPPLGPAASPLDRLLAFGAARIRFAQTHHALLSAAGHSHPAARVLHTHVRLLLRAAGTTGDLDAQTDALLALLDARYVAHRLATGRSVDQMITAWQDVARKLCGR